MSDPPLSDIEFINKLTWVGTTYNFGRDFLINSKIFRIEYFFGPTKIGLTDLIRKLSDGNKSFRSMISYQFRIIIFRVKQIYTYALAGRNFVQGGNPQDETHLLKKYIRSLGGQCRQNIDEKATFLGLVQKRLGNASIKIGYPDEPNASHF